MKTKRRTKDNQLTSIGWQRRYGSGKVSLYGNAWRPDAIKQIIKALLNQRFAKSNKWIQLLWSPYGSYMHVWPREKNYYHICG